MAADEIHVGDVGTVFEATIKNESSVVVNISSATTKQLLFRGNGSSKVKSAAFTTDGTDGKIRYVTVAGDLDWAGQWTWQAYIEMPTGTWHSDVAQFTVHENL